MQSDMTANLQMIGNAALLDLLDKVAFLSSRRISAADVLKCYEWAEKIRDTGTCVISGFQSPLEKDVLKFLLRGKVPIILVLARSLWKTVPEELRATLALVASLSFRPFPPPGLPPLPPPPATAGFSRTARPSSLARSIPAAVLQGSSPRFQLPT